MVGSCRNPASVGNKWESQIVEARKLLSGRDAVIVRKGAECRSLRTSTRSQYGCLLFYRNQATWVRCVWFLPEPSHMGAVCVVKFLHVTHPLRGIALAAEAWQGGAQTFPDPLDSLVILQGQLHPTKPSCLLSHPSIHPGTPSFIYPFLGAIKSPSSAGLSTGTGW